MLISNHNPVIEVSVCENNVFGDRSGKCAMIDFCANGEEIISLEDKHLFKGIPIKTNQQHMQIHGVIIPHLRHTDCAGNMAWNRYDIQLGYALGLLTAMHKSGLWTTKSGLVDIMHQWDLPNPAFTPAMFGFPDYKTEPTIIDPNQLELNL